MEETFDSLDGLFNFGSCTYTTQYKGYNFSVSISCKPRQEEFYNYVFKAEDLRQNIFEMLDQYLKDKKCNQFKACMVEVMQELDVPVTMLPVLQLNHLEVEIRALKILDCYHVSSSEITTSFSSFKG